MSYLALSASFEYLCLRSLYIFTSFIAHVLKSVPALQGLKLKIILCKSHTTYFSLFTYIVLHYLLIRPNAWEIKRHIVRVTHTSIH